MQFSKKLFTATITTLLLVSAIATIIPAFALPTGTASPTSGPVGTRVTITGTDPDTPGAQLNIYWENTGGILLGTTFVAGDGTYSVTVTIPDAIAGPHFIIVQDIIPSTLSIPFTITPAITLTPSRGIPGDTVTVAGSGFNSSSTQSARGNVTITFSNSTGTTLFSRVVAAVNTTSTGNFTVTFAVPTVDYGTYNVNATDQSLPTPNAATAQFVVGASIVLSTTSGPSGTVVGVTGRGFSKIAGLPIITSVGGVTAPQVAPIVTVADGTFTGQIIVPTLAPSSGLSRYAVQASDPNFTAVTSGTGSFRVTATTTVTVSPTSAQPGNTITLTGSGFAQIAGTSVVIRFGQTAQGTLQVATFTTNAGGNFTGSVTVPTLPTSPPTYLFNGTDAFNLTAVSAPFSIAITALFLSPTSGPTGSVVTLTAFGLGITGGTTFNVTIAGTPVTPSTNAVVTGGSTVATFTVPTLPVGTYNVVVTDNLGLSASASFVVTATSTLTVNPSTAPVGVSGVALTLTNFGAGATVSFFITNSTFGIPLVVVPGTGFTLPLVTNASGTATATFTVPQLALGSYIIVANETTGAFNATAAFNVGSATLNVATGALSYAQGSVVSWTIQSTFATSFTINIADPANTPAVVNVLAANFVPVGALQVYPVGLASLALPSDAMTGTWTWNASVTVGTTIVPKSGTFTVTSGAGVSNITNTDLNRTLQTIITKLDALNATVVAINGNIATLSTNTGYVLANVTAIRANLTSISGSIATVTTTLGTLNTSLASIGAQLTSVSGTVSGLSGTLNSINSAVSGIASISSTVGTLQTSLSDIGGKVSSIQTSVGGIATIQTDLGTLTGTVTSIQGNVATIQTNIGTLQTDVSDLQTSVNNIPGQVNVPIYIAIVLALIAAIAAVAGLLLVRRKIAG